MLEDSGIVYWCGSVCGEFLSGIFLPFVVISEGGLFIGVGPFGWDEHEEIWWYGVCDMDVDVIE